MSVTEQAATRNRVPRLVRAGLVVIGVVFGVGLLGAAAAFGYYLTTDSSQPGVGAAASLSAPTTPTATANGSGAITVGWSLPSSQLAGAQYQITRTSGPGSPATVCTVASTATSCQDTGLAPNTPYGYSIAAVLDSWTSASISASATTSTPTFVITLSSGPYTAGTPITVSTVTAKVGGVTDTTYTGPKTITWSGLTASAFGNSPVYPSSAVTFTQGVATPNSTFTAYSAGSDTITATDASASSVTGSAHFTLAAGNAATLTLGATTASPTAGAGDQLSIAAIDSYGNTATGYTGTKTLTFSGASVIGTFHPTVTNNGGTAVNMGTAESINFNNGIDNAAGPANGLMTLYKAETTHIVVTDGSISNGTGLAVTVAPATVSKLAFTSTAVTGAASSTASLGPITVQEQDLYGNPTTTAETVGLASSSTGTAVFSASLNGTSTTSVNILSGSSTASFWYGDTKAATAQLTASASGLTPNATQLETITAAAAAKVAIISTAFSATASTSATNGLTMALEDAFGNPTKSASPTTINLASSSTGAKFAASSGGTAVTSVTLPANTQAVNAFYADTVAGTPTITASASGLTPNATQVETITPAAANKLVFTTEPVGNVTEGTNFSTSPAVSVEDTFGNLVTSDTGQVTLGKASGPASGVLSCSNSGFPTINAVAGVATFTNCQITGTAGAGTYTLSATRSSLAAGTSTNVVINAGTATQLVWIGLSNGTHGTLSATSGNSVSWATAGRGNNLTGQVALADASGNLVNASSNVTVTLSAIQGGVSPTTLTINSGQTTAGPFTFTTARSDSWSSDTFAAAAAGLTSASVAVAKGP